MLKYVLLLSLFVTACGYGGVIYKPKVNLTVNPEFQPYYDDFVQDLTLYKRSVIYGNIEIRFDTMKSEGRAGECHYLYPKHVIKINKVYWDRFNTVSKKIVIYHELGHCMLYKDHNESRDSYGYPASVMYSTLIPSYLFLFKELDYIKELMSY